MRDSDVTLFVISLVIFAAVAGAVVGYFWIETCP
jgi:hypothetical protein